MVDLLVSEAVQIGATRLLGNLVIPAHAIGLVLFLHGSGSDRTSPRNMSVASALHQQHLATLLFELTTEEEARSSSTAFDLDLATQRTMQTLQWLNGHQEAGRYPLGLFGCSTGAAVALVAAARCPEQIKAVVSRGGRPDLADNWLPQVKAPTLLIVGGLDTEVLSLNRQVMRLMNAPKRLEVVPGAGHLFEEPGSLSSVAAYAGSWFQTHFNRERRS
ncbi:MAG: hypothetical protein C0453_02720 [Comamonadaceae bacterium]|nr:hypothetical protein [Comamonadaceae bacterium]